MAKFKTGDFIQCKTKGDAREGDIHLIKGFSDSNHIYYILTIKATYLSNNKIHKIDMFYINKEYKLLGNDLDRDMLKVLYGM